MADGRSAEPSYFDQIKRYFRRRSFSADNLLYWYTPAIGGVSYTLFSVHICNRDFLESLFPDHKHVVANCLLFNAHLGTGLYLYKSRHLSAATKFNRVLYSAYGALLFNFGSILTLALMKTAFPENGIVKTVYCLTTSMFMMLTGKEYIEYVDRWCSKN